MKLKISRKIDKNDQLHLTLTGEMTIYTSAKLKDILFNEIKSNLNQLISKANIIILNANNSEYFKKCNKSKSVVDLLYSFTVEIPFMFHASFRLF